MIEKPIPNPEPHDIYALNALFRLSIFLAILDAVIAFIPSVSSAIHRAEIADRERTIAEHQAITHPRGAPISIQDATAVETCHKNGSPINLTAKRSMTRIDHVAGCWSDYICVEGNGLRFGIYPEQDQGFWLWPDNRYSNRQPIWFPPPGQNSLNPMPWCLRIMGTGSFVAAATFPDP